MTDTFISTVEADIQKAWGTLAADVEKDALTIWADFRAIVTAALPTEYNTLKQFIVQALANVTDGDLADVETEVLNLAAATEKWVENIGSATLQAIIAVVKAGLPAA